MQTLPSSPDGHGPAQRDDEVFDIVNERDEVVGQATRREVHARGLWHRAVHVLVFSGEGMSSAATAGTGMDAAADGKANAGPGVNADEGIDPRVGAGVNVGGGLAKVGKGAKVFLQKRSMAKDTAPGCWDSSCSGHLDTGEDYAVAAVRELREEIGLAVSGPEALTPLLKFRACADTGWEFVWIYWMKSEGPFVINPAEIERGEWWRVEEVTRGIAERPAEFSRAFRFLWGKVAASAPDGGRD